MRRRADTPTERRAYDSAATRRALLDAAQELFAERGFDGATTRDIGERAGVDISAIARYFDSKEGLFLAVIARSAPERASELDPERLAALLLTYCEQRGQAPVARALAAPAASPAVAELLRSLIGGRLVEPLAREVEGRRGADAAELRAELLVAMVVGIALVRANGALEQLSAATLDEVVALVGPALRELV
jgi:AcrR family transcriptional regulator